MQYRKKFTIDGLAYRFEVSDAGSVSFYVIGGATKMNAFVPRWNDDAVDFGMRDRNYFKNSKKVFTKLESIMMEWLGSKKPHMFFFTSNTDKKQKVYTYLAKKLAKKLVGAYTMAESDGVFYYFAVQEPY
jgi:hypothetical protein